MLAEAGSRICDAAISQSLARGCVLAVAGPKRSWLGITMGLPIVALPVACYRRAARSNERLARCAALDDLRCAAQLQSESTAVATVAWAAVAPATQPAL